MWTQYKIFWVMKVNQAILHMYGFIFKRYQLFIVDNRYIKKFSILHLQRPPVNYKRSGPPSMYGRLDDHPC